MASYSKRSSRKRIFAGEGKFNFLLELKVFFFGILKIFLVKKLIKLNCKTVDGDPAGCQNFPKFSLISIGLKLKIKYTSSRGWDLAYIKR